MTVANAVNNNNNTFHHLNQIKRKYFFYFHIMSSSHLHTISIVSFSTISHRIVDKSMRSLLFMTIRLTVAEVLLLKNTFFLFIIK